MKFDIYGPPDPESYWHSCQSMLASLPENVKVEYRGNLPNERVPETLFGYDFFFLPTLCENFGHAIFESFSAGCPVLISDQTPWRNLTDRHLGWDISLGDPDRWRSVLQECIDMEALPHDVMSKACTHFAGDWLRSSGVLDKTIALFRDVVEEAKRLSTGGHSIFIACTNCLSWEPTTKARSTRRGTRRIGEGADKMRILLLCQYYPPELALIWPHELARELVRRGHEVTSLTAMPNRGQPRIYEGYRRKVFHCEQMDGVRIIRSWIYATTSKKFFPRAMNFGTFCGSSLIAGLLGATAPDVIYAVLPPLPLGVTAGILASAKRARLIVNIQDIFPRAAVEYGMLTNPRDPLL